ncbi:MAG TPA: 50S ribosomal protein L21 [Candidatus Limnocylindria bacterium]
MYAVVSTGGKQYRVEAGNELIVERVGGDAGSTITFDRVLLVGDGEAVTVGTPTVEGATVSGTVLGEALGPKLIVFKYKQKATYRRKNGHRQHLTRVRIDEISAGGKKTKPAAKADVEAKADAAAEAPKAEKAERKPAARRTTAKAKAKAGAGDASAAGDEAKPKRTRKPAAKKAEADE